MVLDTYIERERQIKVLCHRQHQGSISPNFFLKTFMHIDLNSTKNKIKLFIFFLHLGSSFVKAARNMLVKSIPNHGKVLQAKSHLAANSFNWVLLLWLKFWGSHHTRNILRETSKSVFSAFTSFVFNLFSI